MAVLVGVCVCKSGLAPDLKDMWYLKLYNNLPQPIYPSSWPATASLKIVGMSPLHVTAHWAADDTFEAITQLPEVTSRALDAEFLASQSIIAGCQDGQ